MNRPTHRMPRSLPVAIAAASLAGCLALAGVAGAATTTTSPPGARAFPGASGSVAAIAGSSMEVQNQQTGQVTVNWGPSTSFTQTVTVPASSVAVGDCVTVTGSSSKGTITATSVGISQAVSGKCTGEAFGGGQRRGGFTPPPGGFARGQRPGGFTPPSGGSGTARRFGTPGGIAFASGKVTKVTAEGLAVSGISSAAFAKAAKKTTKPTKPAAVKTTTTKVRLTSSTTYTESQAATSTNLAVGDCVTAAGSSDSTGAVTASTVRITSTGGKSCTSGFGGFGRGPGGG